MSLADDISTEVMNAPTGALTLVIRKLEGVDLADFINALNNTGIPANAISKALAVRGLGLDPRRINEYRNNNGRLRYGIDGERVS